MQVETHYTFYFNSYSVLIVIIFSYRKPTRRTLETTEYLETLKAHSLALDMDDISVHRGLDDIEMPEIKSSPSLISSTLGRILGTEFRSKEGHVLLDPNGYDDDLEMDKL